MLQPLAGGFFVHSPIAPQTETADAIFDLGRHPSPRRRLVMRILGATRPGATWLERFRIRDRAAALRRVYAWR